MNFVKVSTDNQAAIVESLAREIWTEHYTPIIGREQVEYMLGRFQTRQAVSEQIRSGILYFLMQEGKDCIGYMAVETRGDELFLSKFYVRSSLRGRGYGKKAAHYAETLARERGVRKLALTVNKNNTVAIRAYEKMGFKNVAALVQDIGGGFVMDDFRMEKEI